MTNVVTLNVEDEEERSKAIDAFNTVAARYQFLQSEATKTGLSDKQRDALSDEQDVAIWNVIRTHAEASYQVDFKLQILRELIAIGSGWIDNREFFLIESIRHDVA
jgi:hypothetical protein